MQEQAKVDILTSAESLIQGGFAVFPCYGTTTKVEAKRKAAMMEKGSHYYKTGVPLDIFKSQYYKSGIWIGVRCGKVSGNLECLDFDNKFGDAFSLYEQFISIPDVKAIIETYGLYVEKTVGGGVHICYRTHQELEKVDDGGKLARRLKPETNEVIALIETRTEGQYFVCAPSDGYTIISGDLLTMQPIEMEERNFLIEMAKSMDEYLDPKKLYAPPAPKRGNASANDSMRPGAHFDQSDEGLEEMVKMLKAENWTNVYENKWRRPGKTDGGISATLGHIAPNVFYCFSSNAHPFEQGKCYTPFSMLTLLHYGGDFSKCARALADRGFGLSWDDFRKKDSGSNENEYKAAIPEAYDVVKRIKKGQTYTEKDVQFLARQSGVSIESANQALEIVTKENPELFGFDFLQPLEKSKVWINKNYIVKKNKFTNTITIYTKSEPQRQVNENDVYLDLNINKVKTKKEDLNAILHSSIYPDTNPLEEYLKSLPEWKESDTDYISMYASYFKVNEASLQPYFELMFKKHIVRSLYCTLLGIENRYVFVLLGEQEDGKSTFIKKLCFDENYYTQRDITDGNSKDIQIAMYENVMWQFEEIDSLTPSQLNKLKALVSTGYDKTRDVYAKKAEYRQRIVNFWASGNKNQILTDETGNSRFLVFRGKITSHDYNNHKTGVVKVPLELLWAQAYYIFNKGRDFFDPELTYEEKKERDNINIGYEVSNDVEGHLADLFEPAVGVTIYWSVSKIVRYLSKRKIFSTGKQVSYAIEKLSKRGVWNNLQSVQQQGTILYAITIKKTADSDFQFFQQTMTPTNEDDLPF